MKLYSFLGTSKYEPCRYISEDSARPFRSPSVRFVQTASALQIGEALQSTIIFGTQFAFKKNRDLLDEEFKSNGLPSPTFVLVPDGQNQKEIYKLFESLNKYIDQEVPAVFDITHGYRSQPVLGILVLNYLESLSETFQVADLLYGAFGKAGRNDDGTPDTEYPLVSLMPLWELNKWAAGFHIFEKTGDAKVLSEYAGRAHDEHMKHHSYNPNQRPRLQSFASTLLGWQQNMDLCAIPQLYGRGKGERHLLSLERQLDQEWNDLTNQMGRFVKPLRQKVDEIVRPMFSERWDSIEGLQAQLHMMKWMHQYGRYQPFLTIAREWLSTLVAIAIDKDADDISKYVLPRLAHLGKKQENLTKLSDAESELKEKKEKADPSIFKDIERLQNIFGDDFFGIIDSVTNARNCVNHCWFQDQEANAFTKVNSASEKVLIQFPEFLEMLSAELETEKQYSAASSTRSNHPA